MPASFAHRFYVINGVASPLLNTSIEERDRGDAATPLAMYLP